MACGPETSVVTKMTNLKPSCLGHSMRGQVLWKRRSCWENRRRRRQEKRESKPGRTDSTTEATGRSLREPSGAAEDISVDITRPQGP